MNLISVYVVLFCSIQASLVALPSWNLLHFVFGCPFNGCQNQFALKSDVVQLDPGPVPPDTIEMYDRHDVLLLMAAVDG